MREIKKLGFGLMRLPQNSANGADIDMEQCKKMVDLFLERGFTYFDTSYVYHNGAFDVTTALREASKPSTKTASNPTWIERGTRKQYKKNPPYGGFL